jgi:DNA-binding NarL/FixJ family response regulator
LENKVLISAADRTLEATNVVELGGPVSGKKMTPRERPLRIVAADSNHMGCHLLSEALNRQPGLSVVASSVDYESLRQSVDSIRPDIVLISANLRGGPLNSGRCMVEASSRTIPCPWVLLLDESEPHLVVAAFRAGARGVFSRSQSDIGLLAKCIRRVVEGQIWVDNRQMLYLLEAFNNNGNKQAPSNSHAPNLTPREESVVKLVVQGMVNREIAEELQLSEHTVKNYLFRIFDKLGVSNRVELALYAVAKLKPEGESAA